ncbi:hypothetical protein B0H13DRAFT_1857307 [Mycena leptocephala]|nr:hypothetical protein B0H13DRAFT_1857307 [Mycena leptocephala]
MTEYTSPMHTVPSFPDDSTLPQFHFDYQHPICLHRDAKIPWLVDAVTGRSLPQDEVVEGTWSLANGLSQKFSIGPDDIASSTEIRLSDNDLGGPSTRGSSLELTPNFISTVNPTYTVEELLPHLTDMKPSLLVVHPSALDNVRAAATQVEGIPHDRIVLFESSTPFAGRHANSSSEVIAIQDLVNLGHSAKETHQFYEFKLKPREGKTKTVIYFPCSGTTGVPKMVAIPHSSFIANIIQTAAHDAGVDVQTGRCVLCRFVFLPEAPTQSASRVLRRAPRASTSPASVGGLVAAARTETVGGDEDVSFELVAAGLEVLSKLDSLL